MCTGYGGLDLAVEAHFGAELAWYSELDKNCSHVLEHHWPGVPNHGDLTKADWLSVEPVDIMCAGFPCQPFSHAGKREGAEDERAIWPIIANAISVLRPSIIVLENVAGVLTLAAGATAVTGDLASMGYDCRWGVIRASEAGAPHQRKRWFCIAYTGGERHGSRENGGSVGQLDGQTQELTPERQRPRQEPKHRGAATTAWGRYTAAVSQWERVIGRLAPEPTDKTGVAPEFVEWMMGLPEGWVTDLDLPRAAQLKMLGNGVVPQQAALALEALA